MGMSTLSPSTASFTGGTSPALIFLAEATARKQRKPTDDAAAVGFQQADAESGFFGSFSAGR